MNVLVTGGGGFLGGYIVTGLLERGWEVAVFGRSARPDLEKKGVRIFRGDLSDPEQVLEACKGFEAVFHVAAQTGVWGGWESFYRPNVDGTQNVINACREQGVRNLVYTSTPSVVFTGEALRAADETQPYGDNWLCNYAHTKSIAEHEVLEADDPDGLRTVALRPHLIWGVGDPHLVPRIIEQAKKGRLRIVGDGDNLVDITHVANAASAHLLALDALERGVGSGKAYFISQGEPVRLWDWINDLLGRLGIPQVDNKISLNKAYAAGAVLEGIWKVLHLKGEPPITRFVAVELAKDHYFNIEAARRDLGYEPTVSTEAGLVELVAHLGGKKVIRRKSKVKGQKSKVRSQKAKGRSRKPRNTRKEK